MDTSAHECNFAARPVDTVVLSARGVLAGSVGTRTHSAGGGGGDGIERVAVQVSLHANAAEGCSLLDELGDMSDLVIEPPPPAAVVSPMYG